MIEIDNINVGEILTSLEESGYYIIRGMYSKEFCNSIIEQMKNAPYERGDGGDGRCPMFDRFSEEAKSFMNNPLFTELCGKHTRSTIITEDTRCQAGIVSKDIGSVDSGGGWHVDNHARQFKALLYLNDVDEKGGPFSILEGSRKTHRNIQTYAKVPGDNSETRYSEEFLRETPEWENLKILTGNAGDVILVDTSNIHRGSTIEEGTRYTLTNYFYTESMRNNGL